MRAAIYIRVSTQRQVEDDKISLSEQELREREYCDPRKYDIFDLYSDIASGSTKKRPGFQRMLTDARQGKFDVVGAGKAGMKGVLLDRSDYFKETTDCPRIRSLTQLVEHL